jgi:hypothetical protein
MNEQTQSHVRKPSQAKSVIAQQKTRDEYGHFVSGAEAQAALARKQQIALQAEQDKFNAVLGRQPSMQPQMNNPMPVQQNFQPQQYMPQQSNFQQILNANKPGSIDDVKRWNSLLGRDDTSKNKKTKNYRW